MQTIGERLEEARKKKGVSIREAAEATKIRGDYLQKFESNQFDIGLTEIYTRGFLRTYSSFLKLPVDRLMSDYAALGRGEVRPRQPNREIYGRMDITVASSNEAAERAAPPEEAPPPEQPAPARPQPRYPRGTGSSLPTGLDPAVMYKWLKIGGIIVALILVIAAIKVIFTGNKGASPSTAARPTTAPITQPTEPVVTILAQGTVTVTISRKNPDGTFGDTLFDGVMLAGESKVIPRRGALFIKAVPPENMIMDINGSRQRLPAGYNVGELPAPKQ